LGGIYHTNTNSYQTIPITVPNSSFVPPDLLNAHGYIKVDQYLAIEGRQDVFAIGDVSNVEAPQFWFVNTQAGHMAKNLVHIMIGKPMIPYKASTTGKSSPGI
ncbi:hypothetical protein ACKRZS_007168, partial [Fusarium odoratissimum]